MNPSTAQAEVVVDELVRDGVRDVVLSPGSRNAPLSFAWHAAARSGRVRLHVRIDERSAGFLALGLAARSGRPVVVVCTSGTAAVNLGPAVAEAWHSGVPLLVLTTDRPPQLRAAGANQTVDQQALFREVRLFDELAVAESVPGQNAYWRSQVCRAWHAAAGAGRLPAPVQVNVPLREPLVPDGDQRWCEDLAGRADGGPWTRVAPPAGAGVLTADRASRGVVLVAEDAADVSWAAELGWPVLAESGGLGVRGDSVLPAGMWLLASSEFLAEHRPEQVICVGRPTVFRQVQRLLADAGIEVSLVHPEPERWPAPGHDVREVAAAVGAVRAEVDAEWLPSWRAADQRVSAAVRAAVDDCAFPVGAAVAGEVVSALPSGAAFVVGSSNPTRDVALAARHRPDVVLRRNRGVAGIDGMVSTVLGTALAHDGPTYALLGDLTFLHDTNGLLIGPDEPRPDVTIVVFNDDGGGIFSLLEQGSPEHATSFERVFGTPHGTDVAALCRAHGVEHVAVRSREELRAAVRWNPGLRVVEVRAERGSRRSVRDRLSEVAEAACHRR